MCPSGFGTSDWTRARCRLTSTPPTSPRVQLEISRGDTRRIAFGLIPLGAIEGRVTRDANKNGKADPEEEPVDGAVIILDGGARSEQVRKGRYRFDAVRSGEHTVKLLIESLPDGSAIAGSAEVKAALVRDHLLADVPFTVSIEKRPEIRKVFPPKGGTAAAGRPDAAAPPARRAPAVGAPARSTAPPPARRAVAPPPATGQAAFAVQIAALSDLDNARAMVLSLSASGWPAYLVEPADGDSLYRVRVGTYDTRADAQKMAVDLERVLGMKLWLIRERQ